MKVILLALLVSVALCAGCESGLFGENPADFVKPTIAVMKFENRAPFPLNWDIGDGMRDILVDRLVATGRYHVLERPELDSVLSELRLQHSGITRQQRRAALGRIKNVRYLIKGTVTDFGHVSTERGFLGLGNLDAFGGSSRAVMGMTLYVVDVESGEIVSSKSISESVRASDVTVKAAYKDVAMGGSVFYRTPLGKVTTKVIGKAVRRITSTIAAQPWIPKIALVRDDRTIIVNGGRDRGLRAGDVYEVFERGSPIIDPDTGDSLGHQPGKTIGHVQICRVHPRYSRGEIVLGKSSAFKVGQRCRRVENLAAK